RADQSRRGARERGGGSVHGCGEGGGRVYGSPERRCRVDWGGAHPPRCRRCPSAACGEITYATHRPDASVTDSRYKAIFDRSPDGILLVDGEGMIRQANARALEMFGYAEAGLDGVAVE